MHNTSQMGSAFLEFCSLTEVWLLVHTQAGEGLTRHCPMLSVSPVWRLPAAFCLPSAHALRVGGRTTKHDLRVSSCLRAQPPVSQSPLCLPVLPAGRVSKHLCQGLSDARGPSAALISGAETPSRIWFNYVHPPVGSAFSATMLGPLQPPANRMSGELLQTVWTAPSSSGCTS